MAAMLKQRVSTWGTTVAIVVLGLGVLTAQHFSPPPAGVPTAVLVPPWRIGGMAFAAEVGLPVIDIRLGGHLLIFAASDSPLPLSRMGPFVMPAIGPFGCATGPEQTEATRT